VRYKENQKIQLLVSTFYFGREKEGISEKSI